MPATEDRRRREREGARRRRVPQGNTGWKRGSRPKSAAKTRSLPRRFLQDLHPAARSRLLQRWFEFRLISNGSTGAAPACEFGVIFVGIPIGLRKSQILSFDADFQGVVRAPASITLK